ncbi:MAG: radical SAM protein [Oscillospiraceae bacterium]|nr:radical SAM protein [Oscillospiraceae bacterium]
MLDYIPEEIEKKLYKDEIVYRPPVEAEAALLEVSRGCTWGKCTFCRDQYRDHPFEFNSLESIREKLELLATIPEVREKKSLYLVGENVLALKTDYLLGVFEAAHEILPNITRFATYARSDDVLRKSEEKLKMLVDAGLDCVYIGLESGLDEVLELVKKGVTVEQFKQACARLDKVGMGYGGSIILGLGGRHRCLDHAIATAEVVNSVHMRSLRVMTLTVTEGAAIEKDIKEGRIVEMSPAEILLEERVFLDHLTAENLLYVGTHVSNNIPIVGILPRDKDKMLNILDSAIFGTDPEQWHKKEFEHM